MPPARNFIPNLRAARFPVSDFFLFPVFVFLFPVNFPVRVRYYVGWLDVRELLYSAQRSTVVAKGQINESRQLTEARRAINFPSTFNRSFFRDADCSRACPGSS